MALKLDILKDVKNADSFRSYSYADLHLDLELNSHMSDKTVGANKNAQDLKLSYDENAIYNSIKNIFNTKKGQKILAPTFGLDLEQYLFDNKVTLVDSLFEQNSEELVRRIQDGLNEDIEFWLPYIIVDNIEVVRTPDQHLVDVSLNFRVTEQGANQEIKIIVGENGMELNNNIL